MFFLFFWSEQNLFALLSLTLLTVFSYYNSSCNSNFPTDSLSAPSIMYFVSVITILFGLHAFSRVYKRFVLVVLKLD